MENDLHDQYYQRLYREQSYDDNKVCFKSSIDSKKPSKLIYLFNFITLNICFDLEPMNTTASSSLSAHRRNFHEERESINYSKL